jgi:hypothetical protein
MGKLVRYTDIVRIVPDVPEDAIGAAEWVHGVLCTELHNMLADAALVGDKRRDTILKLSARVVQATPHSELYKARESLREDEEQISSKGKLRGKLEDSVSGRSRHLHAAAPRGRTKRS